MNPFLDRLGFGAGDRAVIIHADDLGMCHAANGAYMDIVAQGVLCTRSIMAFCPWSNEVAAFARERASGLDVGVYLTLNCECTPYRRGLSMPKGADRLAEFSAILHALPPGLTHLYYHPARPGPEIEGITSDWPMRVADRAAFTDPRLPQVLSDSGVKVLQYRHLREVMRGEPKT